MGGWVNLKPRGRELGPERRGKRGPTYYPRRLETFCSVRTAKFSAYHANKQLSYTLRSPAPFSPAHPFCASNLCCCAVRRHGQHATA
eukprot:3050704-Heterocapsa_arctica.AAC.1